MIPQTPKESDFVKHLRDFLLRLPDEKFCYSSWAYESGDPECGTDACVGEADRIEPYADRETVILHYNEIIEELEILESIAS